MKKLPEDISFDEIYNDVEKIDSIIMKRVKEYDSLKLGINRLKVFLPGYIDRIFLFKKHSIDIEDKDKGFGVDYYIYLDKYIISIHFDILGSGGYLFFKYNNIYLLSKDGEVLNDITNECVKKLLDIY